MLHACIGWNMISRSYQKMARISLEDMHAYGAISPGESELKLLGGVEDKDVLKIVTAEGKTQ